MVIESAGSMARRLPQRARLGLFTVGRDRRGVAGCARACADGLGGECCVMGASPAAIRTEREVHWNV